MRDRGAVFGEWIQLSKKVVARLVPATVPKGLALTDLNRLFASLPQLSPAEARKWQAENMLPGGAKPPQTRKCP